MDRPREQQVDRGPYLAREQRVDPGGQLERLRKAERAVHVGDAGYGERLRAAAGGWLGREIEREVGHVVAAAIHQELFQSGGSVRIPGQDVRRAPAEEPGPSAPGQPACPGSVGHAEPGRPERPSVRKGARVHGERGCPQPRIGEWPVGKEREVQAQAEAHDQRARAPFVLGVEPELPHAEVGHGAGAKRASNRPAVGDGARRLEVIEAVELPFAHVPKRRRIPERQQLVMAPEHQPVRAQSEADVAGQLQCVLRQGRPGTQRVPAGRKAALVGRDRDRREVA